MVHDYWEDDTPAWEDYYAELSKQQKKDNK